MGVGLFFLSFAGYVRLCTGVGGHDIDTGGKEEKCKPNSTSVNDGGEEPSIYVPFSKIIVDE